MIKKIVFPTIIVVILAGIIYVGTSNLPKQDGSVDSNNDQAPLVEDPNDANMPEDSGATEAVGEPLGTDQAPLVEDPNDANMPEDLGATEAGGEPLAVGEEPIGIADPISQEPTAPAWQLPDNPTQSLPLEEGEWPNDAIKISMTAQGISPNPFEVKRGAEVTLVISSSDNITHVFKFKDPILAEVAVGLGRGQTRAITFYAPTTKGDYEAYCDVPGHEGRGEKGVMTVK